MSLNDKDSQSCKVRISGVSFKKILWHLFHCLCQRLLAKMAVISLQPAISPLHMDSGLHHMTCGP